jgi:hypothetical protein
MGSKVCLEAGWDPEPVWRLDGIQNRSGGWMGSRAGLEARWDPEPDWRLDRIQSLTRGWMGSRACLEAGWVLQSVWKLKGRKCPHSFLTIKHRLLDSFVHPLLSNVGDLSLPALQ